MNKCRAGLVWVMLMLSISGRGFSQVLDNFGDGNFSANPQWQGDSLGFIINVDGQLQLAATGVDTSYLSVSNTLFDSTEWRFWIRLAFSPSSSNFGRVYLASDQADLKGPLNGYFLQFGQAGSNDAIILYRQEDLDTFRICAGTPGLIAAGFTGRVKVTRKGSGNWAVFVDQAGGEMFQPECAGTDQGISQTGYFGLQCRYTSSNATRFYFDDFIIREILLDLEAPTLVKVAVRDSLSLDVFISEAVDWQQAAIPQHYNVDNGIGVPLLALPDNQVAGLIHLQFQQAFQEGVNYTLCISDLRDLAGNVTQGAQGAFVFYGERQFDVVLNEVMYDPDPVVGLPSVEYVELYNRSDHPVLLKGWQYGWGSSTAILPDTVIDSKTYLLLCNTGDGTALSSYGNYLEINGFSLSNSGTSLVLKNAASQVIASLDFSPDWILNPLKKEGGWSLEQVDPFNPCAGSENWRESTATAGGTPGKINSINAQSPDQNSPRPLRAYPKDNFTISVIFSESIDSASLLQAGMYRLNPGNKIPQEIILKCPSYQQLDLKFADSLQRHKIYALHFLHQFKDCAGNTSLADDSLRVALPEKPLPGDVVLNEILFHPKTGGSEFAELYNLSNKTLDLKDLVIGMYDNLSSGFSSQGRISEESYLLFPGDYLVLSDKPEAVLLQYLSPNPDGIIQAFFFPTLTDAGGILALADLNAILLDKAPYSESMHYPLLASTTGVSLEKIRPDAAGDDKSSWHSAASSCGYATPAYRNSQSTNISDSPSAFSLQPSVITPNNDGNNDILTLTYSLSDPGYQLSVSLFNEDGIKVKTLVNNELLGTSGFYTWDGLSDRQTLCPAGVYVCFIELFKADGSMKKVKLLFGIGGD